MKIKKIKIENFRLLKDFELDLEDELSLVIGKNNSGKTSILTVLDKFLNYSEKKILFNDFNIDFKNELKKLIEDETIPDKDTFENLGIKLKLVIEYFEDDNLSNINKVMMDLDPENNIVVLGFEYIITYDRLISFREKYREFKAKEDRKIIPKKGELQKYQAKDIIYFLNANFSEYFRFLKKSIEFDKDSNQINESRFIDLENDKISLKEIINFKFISARRDVTNKEIDKSLSRQTSKIYAKTETDADQDKKIEDFKDELASTDNVLTNIYKDLFNKVIGKVSLFGGIKLNDSMIEIISTLQHRELLEGNTTVVYSHDDNDKLPENFNGLGYMNLISMIFEIEILVEEFKKSKDENPSDINLLFIEEPEAHTHPQMQYIFIKNIKTLLKDGIEKTLKNDDNEEIIIRRELQYIVTTHSSHIVAESSFDDIKYLKKIDKNSIVARNLKSLEKEYLDEGQKKNYRFLKQYLTLNRAELFFADKVIFIEGDTERILLPAMMTKIDQEIAENPLLSQNISIIEVGNYANVFEKFIDFIGIKSLVITDIDSVKKDFLRTSDGEIKKTKSGLERMSDFSCRVAEGERSMNPTINYFLKGINFDDLKSCPIESKRLIKNVNWEISNEGYLQIVFQQEENGYQARSFEDAFFNITENILFVRKNKAGFNGLKNIPYFYKSEDYDAYDLAEKCIESKGTFAIDILLNSEVDEKGNKFSNWEIPSYIREGLIWLKES